MPEEGGIWADICLASGFLAGPDCPERESALVPSACIDSEPCPYHSGGEFVLSPAMEWYYKPHHPEYTGATKHSVGEVMEFIYPSQGSTLTLPRQISSEVEGAVFRVAHQGRGHTIWWHLDGDYVGETRHLHELRLAPSPGKHTLTVVDDEGNTAYVVFWINPA